jgi:hypothetical protein
VDAGAAAASDAAAGVVPKPGLGAAGASLAAEAEGVGCR